MMRRRQYKIPTPSAHSIPYCFWSSVGSLLAVPLIPNDMLTNYSSYIHAGCYHCVDTFVDDALRTNHF